MFSRPLLFLSVATAFPDQSDCNSETSDGNSGTDAHSEAHSDSPSLHSSFDARYMHTNVKFSRLTFYLIV